MPSSSKAIYMDRGMIHSYVSESGHIIEYGEAFSPASKHVGQHITSLMKYRDPEELMVSAYEFEQFTQDAVSSWRGVLSDKSLHVVAFKGEKRKINGKKLITIRVDEEAYSSSPSDKNRKNQIGPMDTKDTLVPGEVLIVDDSEITLKCSSKIVFSLGHRITLARTGLECLNEIKKRGPTFFQFVLMDMNMPVMGGLETIEEIRKWEATMNCAPMKIIPSSDPVINMGIVRELQNLGCPFFLPKPLTKEKLVDIIHGLNESTLSSWSADAAEIFSRANRSFEARCRPDCKDQEYSPSPKSSYSSSYSYSSSSRRLDSIVETDAEVEDAVQRIRNGY